MNNNECMKSYSCCVLWVFFVLMNDGENNIHKSENTQSK